MLFFLLKEMLDYSMHYLNRRHFRFHKGMSKPFNNVFFINTFIILNFRVIFYLLSNLISMITIIYLDGNQINQE